jgi:hypothetical protein
MGRHVLSVSKYTNGASSYRSTLVENARTHAGGVAASRNMEPMPPGRGSAKQWLKSTTWCFVAGNTLVSAPFFQ